MMAREQVLSLIGATPAPTRQVVVRRRWIVAVAAAAWSVAVTLGFDGVRIAPRPVWLVVATAVASALASAGLIFTAATRGPTLVGRSGRALAFVVVVAPAVLLAWKVGVTACFDGMSDAWPFRPGTRCLSVSLLSSVGPFLGLLWARRRSVTDHARWTGAALGVAAGSVGWLVNDLRCQVGYFGHLLLGHLLPVVAFAALGVAFARYLEPRWRPIR